MPSPKRRAKTLRGPLTEAEIAELLAGGPGPGDPSAFATASDFLAARSRLAEQEPKWSTLEHWLHQGRAIDIRFRRHMAGNHPPIDPEHPALVSTSRCPACQSETAPRPHSRTTNGGTE